MNQYDVIVIGAGAGGYIAAIRSAEAGLKTAIIERDALGGVCLNVGCIPSKSLLKNAEVARTLRKNAALFGVSFDNLQLDYAAAVERSRKVSKRLNQGVAFLMKKNAIDVHEGSAIFEDAHSIRVEKTDGSSEQITARFIIIAAGTHPFDIPGVTPDGEKILNYRQAILQTKRPESVVIIGGGAIGVEFATIWSAYGTQVTVVEMKERLLPNEEPEAGAELERAFKKQGIKVRTGAALTAVNKTENGIAAKLRAGTDESEIEAEQILIAIGFQPNTPGLGLEAAGVATHERGWILTDAYGKTNVPHIYAIGDITGKILLAHAASAMGRTAAESIAGLETQPLNVDLVPHTTFSFPQVASFGLTESMAAERGIPVRVAKAGFIANGKALGIAENEGWAKIVSHSESGVVLGATLVGPEVSELLPELTLAASKDLTLRDLANNIHAHPTLNEIIFDAALEGIQSTRPAA